MPHPGTIHKYTKKLIAFEHTPPTPTPSPSPSPPQNTLLWIGGLGDGLLTVTYPTTLTASLPPTWTLAEVLLRSSYSGWAHGSLARDARELGQCVAYFRALRPGGKIVLMGHSTGCQDLMDKSSRRGAVEGIVLQGGVSDREAWGEILGAAREMVGKGEGDKVVCVSGNFVEKGLGVVGISAYRTVSLLGVGGDDDYFSADLGDEVLKGTFGRIPAGTRVCFLLGELDPYVPKAIDRGKLLERWTKIVREGGGTVDDVHGGVVPGAHHNLNGDPDDVVQDLVRRVVGFLKGVDGTTDESSRL
ncbi:hypothetical protein GQ44DRAFT_807104 [Phaeosphaeriaceae sp. PMI808]|nr:hypothetical protein GQ44DRAFT_807104 [Phaeosphaeriaceae sp. PMI808]